MSGNDDPAPAPTQAENLAAVLASLAERGVLFKLCDGVFRFADPKRVLSADEETGLEVCRSGLTEYLRIEAGLCVACAGEPAKAVLPDYGAKLRAKYSPVWCRACWRRGTWRA